ncbi:hypothetical protein [Nocardia mexicana]|uniref:Uncharacterized protein n=1 Tax=Nocardia mexicana TaxID=279262 RepID=A0A370HD97_9NOCA|nr:hypothetical protein [Nocardia mexicana]RDI55197.1 hypothetical protein DFR68_10129 [Nocardia mexicana]
METNTSRTAVIFASAQGSTRELPGGECDTARWVSAAQHAHRIPRPEGLPGSGRS